MNYEQSFLERGRDYDAAMLAWPDARREEFECAIRLAGLAGGERVIDVPAGGGYLARYLPAGCAWFGHEPCASFLRGGARAADSMLPLPWTDGFADVAISVAGVHHMDDKRPLFEEIHRVLRPAGRFVLADVHRDSAVARFLDDFAGRYIPTGHVGSYLDERTPVELADAGFEVLQAQRRNYHWWFPDRRALAAFCSGLFGLSGVDEDTVLQAADSLLGTTTGAAGIGLRWELFAILASST